MNAREIVNLLLEADEMSAGDRTGVYVFGPMLPPQGFVAKSVDQVISQFRFLKIIPKGTPDDVRMLDALVDKGYTFLIKHHPGNVEVIGRNVPVTTTPEAADRASQFLGLEKHDAVAHRKHTTDSPKKLDVDRVLYGSKDAEQAAKAKEQTAKERRSVHTQHFGALDPKKAGFDAPAHGVGYSEREAMPLNAPVNVGFQYDMNSEQGIQVMEVIPNGPAAQAGLQAGDIIIQTGKFAPADGGEPIGPFYVYNTNHLSYVLRKADPKYPISFRVHRGDKDMWIPIKPEPKPKQTQQQGPEMTIPAAEVQAAAKPGQRPKLNLQGKLAKMMAQPSKPHPLIPNAKTPARETGNQGANVSSLT